MISGRCQKPLQKQEAMDNLTICFSISANELLIGCVLSLLYVTCCMWNLLIQKIKILARL